MKLHGAFKLYTNAGEKMIREKELEGIITEARLELHEIYQAKRLVENKKLLGRFFKYRNSYGGSTEEQKWWLYKKITHVDDCGCACYWSFQVDTFGSIEIKPVLCETTFHVDAHVEIDEEEFAQAYDDMVSKLESIYASVAVIDMRG